MLKLKRLYLYLIQTFVPVFLMTFGICLFILLMQFLWKYIADLVGKGIDGIVLAELFLYSTLMLIPMALPLAVLLASLMTFGSLGERLELLAIKAAGVSLLRTMKPLIILVSLIAIGAFFFQNEALPRINVKQRSLLISVKQKSPELDIPEGSFYSGISKYNLYVKKKNPITKILYDVMIYDTSEGFDNMSVFVCDSARMRVSDKKDFLLLTLYSGQRFANFRQNNMLNARANNKFVPYGRENFKEKAIIIPFNSDFNRLEESALEGTQISKNVIQLAHSIDSMSIKLDSLNVADRKIINRQVYFTESKEKIVALPDIQIAATENKTIETSKDVAAINFDSLLATYNHNDMIRHLTSAGYEGENFKNSFMFQPIEKIDLQKKIRGHRIEWHRKFALSFACLIFFFIGAPLGAIIRKGGLGMPVVISVILFIIYYIFDNIGYKMARDGVWEVWQGCWLSAAILFPLGVFLTYKAMNDSAIFNGEAYNKYLRKLLGVKYIETKDSDTEIVDASKIPSIESLGADPQLISDLQALEEARLNDIAKNYQQYGYDRNKLQLVLSILKEKGADFFDIRIRNLNYDDAKRDKDAFAKSSKISAILYCLSLLTYITSLVVKFALLNWVLIIVLIVYIGFYIKSVIEYSDFNESIDKKITRNDNMLLLLSFFGNILFYKYFSNMIKKDMNNIKW